VLLDQADGASVPAPTGTPGVPPVSSAEQPPAGTAAGPDQGVIEEARRRQRLRRVRIALGGLLAMVGLGALAWGLGGSGPFAHSRRTRGPGGVDGASRGALGAAGFDVRLSPALDGGQYGWCVGVEEHPGVIAGGGCSTAPVAATPLAMQLSGSSASSRQEVIVVLATPQVAAVLVNGRRRVRTFTLPGLPYGLRAARVAIPLRIKTYPSGRRGIASLPEPKLAALDASGRVIPNRAGHEVRTLSRSTPLHRSAVGPCRLQTAGLPGLAAQWSHVAAAIRPFPGKLIGRSFFSCIDTQYYLHHWPLDAAILLDAADPGAPPAAIPGLTPVRCEHSYFNGPGDFKGELTATRIGDAWLVVAGGSGLDQRMEVLRHLTATVKLVGSPA
jgi:hypothetical protein